MKIARYRQALVLGLGVSGEAAAKLLLSEGCAVTVVDAADDENLRTRRSGLESLDARVHLGATALPQDPFDVCIVSPGITVASPWLKEMAARKVDVLPELELGWSRSKAKTVAVTGTNGKSTVVKWIAESIGQAGRQSVIAGNYGLPVSQAVMEEPKSDWLVLEVSSFQLETVREFRPDVAMLLNLLPNHLDRHADMDAYVAAKARLFSRTKKGDVCVVHAPWLGRMQAVSGGRGRWVSFGSEPADCRFENGRVRRGNEDVADLAGTYFDNEVLGENAAGVVAALTACGVPAEAAERAARTFRALPHRMEEVARAKGIAFINDSKATTLTALAAGVRMCAGKVRLIAGGLLKETDLRFIKEILAQRVSAIYLMGRASDEMAAAWSDVVRCVPCGTLQAALAGAWRDASAGETILLSPGCASFDQFRSYEDRGDQFRNMAAKIIEEEASCRTRNHGVS
ncbi:MAG TPA: UDP-N-acetylmuramoyl-L-alanine--D-glutamate ligase [Kiritimatiellia bacterium]